MRFTRLRSKDAEMRISSHAFDRPGRTDARTRAMAGFTIVETVLAMALIVLLCTSTLAAILEMQFSSKRVADYTSAMAVAEAKVQDIRAVYYNPPNSTYFTLGTVYVTNQNSIALNQAGTTFSIPGTVISKIEYQGSLGHLVTVTATFKKSGKPITATLQTVVNKYSGGEQ
jgi:type II secretory pathway pseudopilin PulG